MKELIKTIRHRLTELSDLKEENIKTHIVVNLFLNNLGYDPKNMEYEGNVGKDRADILYRIDKHAIFLIETKGLSKSDKKASSDLSFDDKKQITEYLNSHPDNIVWGLLTNGRRYILFNNNIKGTVEDKVVFDISIDNKKDQDYLKYFSYENLFISKNTNFFADVAQFKAYRRQEDSKNSSWDVYKSTLFNFFDYYAANHQYSSLSPYPRECLTHITIEDFLSYINGKTQSKSTKSGKIVSSKQTIQNSYSYLAAFFTTLKEKGDIFDHSFKYGREQVLAIYEDTPKIKSENYLSTERYEKILDYLYSEKNNYRNISIFLLCSYYGFERSEVNELIWDNIDLSKGIINLENRSYKMDNLLKVCLKNIYAERARMKSKHSFVITTFSNNKFRKANSSTINAIFNCFENIDKNDSTWRSFSPQYARECLIRTMFESGYSLEQIAAYIGVDVTRIISSIPNEIIISEGKKRLNKGNKQVIHPYNAIVEAFYNKIVD